MSSLEVILAIIGLILTTIGILVAIASVFAQIMTGMFPLSYIEEKIKQKLLNERFSRGPYDKATIERATRYYIRPKCSNIDPAQELEIRHALMATREDLFEKVDYFINRDESHRHLLLLADSGTGKTSFLLNYYAYNARKSKNRRFKIALIPLGIKNADELIERIPNQDETILFLDALDEDKKAIIDHRDRIIYLMDKCYQFKKIIITCRTQFFPKGEEIPNETGIVKLGPRKAGEKGVYEFWKLYLSPFDDSEVKKYIYQRYSFWMREKRRKALRIAQKIPLLAVRPMLLAHIPDIIDGEGEIIYTYQIYEIMVNAWLEREVAWVDKHALRKFSENLAVDLYINQQNRDHDGIGYYELSKLAQKWDINLQDWQLGGRSLLNRDAEDYFKFSHRSILEYLFMKKILLDKLSMYGILLTDQMGLFLSEMYVEVPHLSHLLSIIDKNMVFNFTHDINGTVVSSLPKINWRQIAENKIDNSDNFFEAPKIVLGEKKLTISFDVYLKFRPIIRELRRDGILFDVTDMPQKENFDQSTWLIQVDKEAKLIAMLDIFLSIEDINKSGVITIFPNKDFTVLEVIIQGNPQ